MCIHIYFHSFIYLYIYSKVDNLSSYELNFFIKTSLITLAFMSAK